MNIRNGAIVTLRVRGMLLSEVDIIIEYFHRSTPEHQAVTRWVMEKE